MYYYYLYKNIHRIMILCRYHVSRLKKPMFILYVFPVGAIHRLVFSCLYSLNGFRNIHNVNMFLLFLLLFQDKHTRLVVLILVLNIEKPCQFFVVVKKTRH